MGIENLDARNRETVDRYIAEEWAGPIIITRGAVFDTRDLPGFVFTEGSRITGAVLYRMEGDECEITALFSTDENKGIGTALIGAVIDTARHNHCRRIFLITTNDNTKAIRFYQKRGFTLRAVHIGSIAKSRLLKPQIPFTGIDGIPIEHEFEFEYPLEETLRVSPPSLL